MDTLPYHQIPDYPEEYNAATVAARTIDGLGYRYYWATQGLEETDLDYKPSADSRTIKETIIHILGLSEVTLNAMSGKVNQRNDYNEWTFDEIRKQTLLNLKAASDALKSSQGEDMTARKIVFQRGERVQSFPFWNVLNGPLADAIYHTGQVVAFRRAAGNPIHSGVSVFSGKTRE